MLTYFIIGIFICAFNIFFNYMDYEAKEYSKYGIEFKVGIAKIIVSTALWPLVIVSWIYSLIKFIFKAEG